MIKTVIKHFIYEACIDQFFKGIHKNFAKFNPTKLEIGKVYSRIDYIYKENYGSVEKGKIVNIGYNLCSFSRDYYGLMAKVTYNYNRTYRYIKLEEIYNIEE